MNMDILWQIVLNISVPVLFLIFLMVCVCSRFYIYAAN